MERLRGLVQRLGGGDGGLPVAATNSGQTEEILENLPLTRAFIETLPRTLILQTAAANDTKATEALHLLNRVDELVDSHVTAARDLRAYVAQLSAIQSTLSSATALAKNLHEQLIQLDSLASAIDAERDEAELNSLQTTEDLNFESYARARRTELEKKRKGYDSQLGAFERERISVLSEATTTSRTTRRKQAATTEAGLESVDIAPDTAAGELDDFFGGDGNGESSATRFPPPPPPSEVVRKEKVKGKGKVKKTELPVRGKRPGIMADEDIEDGEEGRKWY